MASVYCVGQRRVRVKPVHREGGIKLAVMVGKKEGVALSFARELLWVIMFGPSPVG